MTMERTSSKSRTMDQSFEEEIRRRFAIVSATLGVLFCFIFGLTDWSAGLKLSALGDAMLGGVLAISAIAIHSGFQASHIIRAALLALAAWFVMLLPVDQTAAVWLPVFPLVAFFALGKREGLPWTVAFIISVVGEIAYLTISGHLHAGSLLLWTSAANLLIISLIIFFYQRLIEWYRDRLTEQNRLISRDAEAAVQESAARFQTIAESLPIPLIITAWENDSILYLNPAAMDFADLDERKIPGPLNMELFVDPNTPDKIRTLLQQNGRIDGMEVPIRKPDGTTVCISLSACNLNFDGHAAVASAFFDITDRIRARKTLERLNEELDQRVAERTKALHEAKMELEHILNNMLDTFYRADADGRINWASASAEQLLGYSIDELLGMDLASLYAEENGREKFLAALKDAGGRITHYETQLRRKDGRIIWVSASSRYCHDQTGKICGVEGIVRDITEIKKAADERRQWEEQFQKLQKMESIGVLAGGVAHDFNNLLASIMGNAELALLDTPADEPEREYLQQIFDASHRGRELVRQMLAYAGKSKLAMERQHLNELLGEVGYFLDAGLKKNIVLDYALDEHLPAILGDAGQLVQVAMNLITNAAEAMEEQGGEIHIRTGSVLLEDMDLSSMILMPEFIEKRYAFLEVSDTGKGIDPAIQERIFEPFFTTKETGTGLGLASLLGIVRSHHGMIRLQSSPGKGTCFTVYFPAMSEQIPATQAVDKKTDLQTPLNGGVLVVDDEAAIRRLLTSMLEREGLEVFVASDGHDAVRQFRRNASRIHLILLDLTMPQMDGEQTFFALRDINPDIPIILNSGFAENEAAKRLADHGLAGFIAKPFTRDRLLKEIRRWMSTTENTASSS